MAEMNVAQWLERNTFSCALGRLKPDDCKTMRSRPKIGAPDSAGVRLFMPIVCEKCNDWKVKIMEFEQKKTEKQAEIPENTVKNTKKCSKCGEIKPISEFYTKKGCKDGRMSSCKGCEIKRMNQRRNNKTITAPPQPPSMRGDIGGSASITPSAYSTNPAFDALLKLMGVIHDAKRSDYASSGNPLGNFEAARMLGIDPMIGILIRMGDKYTRICNLAGKGRAAVKDESITDTLIDLANYSLLAVLSYKKEGKDEKNT